MFTKDSSQCERKVGILYADEGGDGLKTFSSAATVREKRTTKVTSTIFSAKRLTEASRRSALFESRTSWQGKRILVGQDDHFKMINLLLLVPVAIRQIALAQTANATCVSSNSTAWLFTSEGDSPWYASP